MNRNKNDLIICRCEGVRLSEIKRSLRASSAKTVNDVKKLTRAGMGPCQGRTCAGLVESILAFEKGRPSEPEPYRSRPPVRGIPLEILAAAADTFDEPAGPVSVSMLRGPAGEDETQDPQQ